MNSGPNRLWPCIEALARMPKASAPISGNEEGAAEQQDEAADAEQDEQDRREPVDDALGQRETRDDASASPALDPDTPAQHEEHGDRRKHAGQHVAAIGHQRAVADLLPQHAGILHQDAGFRAAVVKRSRPAC
ncbi:MAG: hypothetical protein H6891_03825 [Brucellaceae bacterium]|nr:hypothetical protein [Brucellaceae bacterium]